MTGNIYIDFLLPGNGIEWLFLIVILGLTCLNAIGLKLYAKEEYWEKSWENDPLTDTDDLDADHGSVYDLSDAVATKPENMAVVLPGILLVLGLFGTFLGVGVSLNQATQVLSNSSAEPGEMIRKMLPMLQGMGLTFKTSIYGVFFYLAFKLLYGYWGLEKKRILWVIKRSKPQIILRNEALHHREDERHKNLEKVLTSQTEALVGELKISRGDFNESFEKLILEQKGQLKANSVNNSALINSIVKSENQLSTVINTEFRNYLKDMKQALESTISATNHMISQEMSASRKSAETSTEKFLSGQKEQADSWTEHYNSFISIFNQFDIDLTKLIKSEVEQSRTETSKSMKEQVQITRDGAAETTRVVLEMAKVVQGLKNAIDKFGPQMIKTSETMDKATVKIAGSSEGLKKSIEAFGPQVKQSLESIRNNFVKSIEKSSSEMSKEMSIAAQQISNGVDGMTKANTAGLDNLRSSLKASDIKMGKIAVTITEGSDALSAASKTTERSVERISNNIADNLKAISTSNMHMSSSSDKVNAALNLNAKVLEEVRVEFSKNVKTLGVNIDGYLKTIIEQNKNTGNKSLELQQSINTQREAVKNFEDVLSETLVSYGDAITNQLKTIAIQQAQQTDPTEKITANIESKRSPVARR